MTTKVGLLKVASDDDARSSTITIKMGDQKALNKSTMSVHLPKKGIQFHETIDLKELEKSFVENDLNSGADRKKGFASALESLRVIRSSVDDMDEIPMDMENPSVDGDGNVTLKHQLRFWVEKFVRPWTNNPVAMAHFRSTLSMLKEQQRQHLTNRFIIHPYSLFRVIWDVLMIIVVFTTIIVLPVEVAFYADDLLDPNWRAFNLIVDAVFLFDIAINMRTGYIINLVDEVILNSKAIVINYLKSWFIIDLISSLPLDYMALSFAGEDGQGKYLATTFRALRVVKFLSLLRILRFIRLIRYLSRMKEFMHIDAKILSILKLMMAILVFAHWNACVQYFIIYIQDVPTTSWLVNADLQNSTRWSIYTHALYRGMSHMISIGYGKSPPQTNSETWTVIISMMIGATFYAMFIAHISTIVMSLDASGRHFNEKVCEVKDYMRFRRLPASLQNKVVDYFEYRYQQKYFDEHSILDERFLSYPLRKEIVMHNCRSLVQSVPFLRDSPSEFLVDIILKLTMHVYFPGDIIVQFGKKGDSMYFIEHGMVNIVLPNETVVNTLCDGAHFGEISLLFDEKRIANVSAVETSYIYRLSKSNFDDVLEDYPHMRIEMTKIASERLAQTQKKVAGMEMEDRVSEPGLNHEHSDISLIDASLNINNSNINQNNNHKIKGRYLKREESHLVKCGKILGDQDVSLGEEHSAADVRSRDADIMVEHPNDHLNDVPRKVIDISVSLHEVSSAIDMTIKVPDYNAISDEALELMDEDQFVSVLKTPIELNVGLRNIHEQQVPHDPNELSESSVISDDSDDSETDDEKPETLRDNRYKSFSDVASGSQNASMLVNTSTRVTDEEGEEEDITNTVGLFVQNILDSAVKNFEKESTNGLRRRNINGETGTPSSYVL